MKLIRELSEAIETLYEGEEKNLYIQGVYLQAAVKNKNGRVYPPAVLEREANRYTEECVKHGSAWGELGHPDTPKLNEDRISHRIVELNRKGNDWIGKAIVCETRAGGDVKAMIKSGGRIGISSRGVGTLRHDPVNNCHVVNDDYKLVVGGDIVLNPSAPKAWMDSVMEGADWWLNEKTGEWRQGVNEVREEVRKLTKSDLKDPVKNQKLWESFIRRLGEDDEEKARVRQIAKSVGVTPERVLELFERERANGLNSYAAMMAVKMRLGK